MRYSVAILVSLLVQLRAAPVLAEETPTTWPAEPWRMSEWPEPFAQEAVKGAMMAEALENATELFHHGPSGWPDGFEPRPPEMPLTAWCRALGRTLIARRDVTFTEPVVRAETYDDPALEPWQERCPNLAFNYILKYFSRDEARSAGLPESEPDGTQLRVHAYSTRDFRLYDLDLDNDPDNGKEIVFAGNRAYYHIEAVRRLGLPEQPPPANRNWNDIVPPESVPDDLTFVTGRYAVLNLRACVATYLAFTPVPKTTMDRGTRLWDTGFLEYGGYPYFFEFETVSDKIKGGQHWRIIIAGFPSDDSLFPDPIKPVDLCVMDFH